ncbi:hypothetical protein AB6A40_009267 [Gnathostoma spinigerum]|uniref:Peptidase metallopeptidase domain-containing protein n=1 Tax=Gnathostoma spinigerum TaxID=75299 RepID=A0ABD6EZJ9_9BILA
MIDWRIYMAIFLVISSGRAIADNVADVDSAHNGNGHPADGLNFGRFKKNSLTYRIKKYPDWRRSDKLTKDQLNDYVCKALQNAFKLWGQVTNLQFTESSRPESDITVLFVASYHGDRYPFDGPGGNIAHTFYPTHLTRSGQIHVDETEPWGPGGRNLYWVLAHEVGHVLGLPHSRPPSLMAPGYRGYTEKLPELSSRDIFSIRTLYGERTKKRKITPQNE